MTTRNKKPNHLTLLNTVHRFCLYAITLVITGVLFVENANAQDRTITLDEAIKLGLDNSKTLKLSQSKLNRLLSSITRLKTNHYQPAK
jgi:outer membrane protein